MVNRTRFFFISMIILFSDQLIKTIIRINVRDPIHIIGNFLTIINTRNTGAGFSILQDQRWLLVIISMIAVGTIIYYHKDIIKNPVLAYSFALILGGAIGNLVDRLFFGYVIDFVNFSFWPAFNIADSAISIGAIGVIWYSIKN